MTPKLNSKDRGKPLQIGDGNAPFSLNWNDASQRELVSGVAYTILAGLATGNNIIGHTIFNLRVSIKAAQSLTVPTEYKLVYYHEALEGDVGASESLDWRFVKPVADGEIIESEYVFPRSLAIPLFFFRLDATVNFNAKVCCSVTCPQLLCQSQSWIDPYFPGFVVDFLESEYHIPPEQA